MDFSDVLVGHTRGGLAQVNVLLSAMMGGISGSPVIDYNNEVVGVATSVGDKLSFIEPIIGMINMK